MSGCGRRPAGSIRETFKRGIYFDNPLHHQTTKIHGNMNAAMPQQIQGFTITFSLLKPSNYDKDSVNCYAPLGPDRT